MKKTRLIILTIVVMMALFVVVLPSFAGAPVFDQVQSFERDRGRRWQSGLLGLARSGALGLL